jgi:SAM-dependent methyltransferase
MLTDPGKYWDREWNPERLEVRDMNALELDFPDESFDAVFSSSSIEHFGHFKEVRKSIEEIYRVLKPGGVAAVATEFRLDGEGHGWPGLFMFDESTLRAAFCDGLWWDPMTPLETQVSAATLSAPIVLTEAIAESESGQRGWSTYPHVVLSHDGFLFTSVHVAMVKSAATAEEWRRGSAAVPPPPWPGPTLQQRIDHLYGRLRRSRDPDA